MKKSLLCKLLLLAYTYLFLFLLSIFPFFFFVSPSGSQIKKVNLRRVSCLCPTPFSDWGDPGLAWQLQYAVLTSEWRNSWMQTDFRLALHLLFRELFLWRVTKITVLSFFGLPGPPLPVQLVATLDLFLPALPLKQASPQWRRLTGWNKSGFWVEPVHSSLPQPGRLGVSIWS